MKRYERYKPSGIQWIGEIPDHWEVKKLKYVGQAQLSGVDKKNEPDERKVLLCNYIDVYKNEFIDDNLSFMEASATENEIAKFALNRGDVLITKDSETPDDIANPAFVRVEKVEIICGYHLAHIRTNRDIMIGEYLFRLFQSPDFNARFTVNAHGITRYGLSSDDIKSTMVLLPTVNEQTDISNYLDRKTAQIDDLIAKKQKLIDLLNEEKTAIINQAVTNGLNPNAPMKDSGIPWLGKMPANWEVKRLKYLGNIKYGLGIPPKPKKDGLPLIRATDIQKGEIIDGEMVSIDPEDVPYDRDPVLKKNDIIVVRSGAYTGDSAIIPQKYEGAVAGYDMVVRITKANAVFISYALLSHYVLKLQIYQHRLRAAQPHLNREELGETIVLLPNSGEQEDIVNFIRAKTFDIRDTISRIQREIELLQEYRTVLISEAVTGKIDVRI